MPNVNMDSIKGCTAILLAVAASACAAGKADIPELSTVKGEPKVTITHQPTGSEWFIRFPEFVATADACLYNVHSDDPVEWQQFKNGEIGYELQPDPDTLGKVRAKLADDLPVIPSIRISARMKPSPNRIDLAVTLTNLTDKPLLNVWGEGGCLMGRSERFHDKDTSLSFIETSTGLTRLSEVKRTMPLLGRYMFRSEWYDVPAMKAYEFYWGRSDVKPISGFVASVAADGCGAIAIAYEHAMSIWQNSIDDHRCIHSTPYYGMLVPGQSVTRRGVILFGNTAEELLKRFRTLKYKPDLSLPNK